MSRHWAGQLHDYFYNILSRPETHNFGTWTYTANEKKPLLSYVDTEMETMETDDPITRVTKYQTHLIMLANRLAENPDSKDTADQTNSLARETANLMKNMASHEENILVKNRFLDAAKGLTDSVGELLTASEHCSARPGLRGSRRRSSLRRGRGEAAQG